MFLIDFIKSMSPFLNARVINGSNPLLTMTSQFFLYSVKLIAKEANSGAICGSGNLTSNC